MNPIMTIVELITSILDFISANLISIVMAVIIITLVILLVVEAISTYQYIVICQEKYEFGLWECYRLVSNGILPIDLPEGK